ncbi:MAG: serine hydrolase [Flavobacteriaceae bacterium]|nr:serine hydrolase [Flavobacteriaceae bacterium]
MKKEIKYFIILILILIASFIIYWSPLYVFRVFTWQDADYDDFKKFKFNTIEKSEIPFNFYDGSSVQKEAFISQFESIPGIVSLENFWCESQTYAFLVIRNDTLLYEHYAEGHLKTDLQTSFSVSKSILSILVGIAIQEGKINSEDDPITKYIPELIDQDSGFSEITVSHLLKMMSGLAYDDNVKFPFVNCDDPLTYYHTDLRKMVVKHSKIEAKANTEFKYNNYNAILIGLILERATDQTVSQFMQSKLWQQIGTTYDASWSTDETGFEKMESGFNARPIDLSKLGRLLLNNGQWNGKTIVQQNWIETSTKSNITLSFNNGQKWGYSHMWWTAIKDSTNYDIFGNGRFGQFLYLSPESNTIIVRHGLESDAYNDDDWTAIFKSYLSIND